MDRLGIVARHPRIAALVGAVIVFSVSIERLIYIEYALCFVVGGLAHFYFGVLSFYWIAYILAGAIFLRFVMDVLRTKKISRPRRHLPLILLALLQLFLLLTSLASSESMSEIVIGFKTYLPVWLIALVIAFRSVDEPDYQTMLAAIRRGRELMLATPEADMPGFQGARPEP